MSYLLKCEIRKYINNIIKKIQYCCLMLKIYMQKKLILNKVIN